MAVIIKQIKNVKFISIETDEVVLEMDNLQLAEQVIDINKDETKSFSMEARSDDLSQS